jgi:hypothetical protein
MLQTLGAPEALLHLDDSDTTLLIRSAGTECRFSPDQELFVLHWLLDSSWDS